MNNNNRGRYPPGIGNGRGGGGGNVHSNTNFQARNPNLQSSPYMQRNVQNQQQQQQWLRRNPSGSNSRANEVEKTVQSENIDSR